METNTKTLTRRQLLRSAGVATAGLTFAGLLGKTVASSLTRSTAPPRAPQWRSRPDLRIPTLTILRREPGVSQDPIFIAPYNAPVGQAGAAIVDNDGEAIWENPLAGKVTTNFRVQRYRDSPVLTWWEGTIELGHGVGEYVIADASYSTIRRVQASGGLRGDLHEFVLTPRGTALLTSYIVTKADLSSVGGSRKGTVQDAVFQELDLATGKLLLEWHSLERIPFEESYASVTADWDFFHINSVDLDSDGNLLVSSRSTHTVYKLDRAGKILWRLGGKRSDFAMAPGSAFAWQHDVRHQPSGSLTVFDNGATPAVEKLSRGLILDLDEHAMTATLEREYVHPPILSGSQGKYAVAAERQRLRRLGRNAARLRVRQLRASAVRRRARPLLSVLQGLSPALERASGRGARDRPARPTRSAHGVRQLERRDRRRPLAAARRREPGTHEPARDRPRARVRELAADERRRAALRRTRARHEWRRARAVRRRSGMIGCYRSRSDRDTTRRSR